MNIEESLLLYAVTDRRWLREGQSLSDVIKQAVEGGATVIQLREKELDREQVIKEALDIKSYLNAKNIPLIIDNDIEVTKAAGADGVHVGQDDCPVSEARKLLGKDFIIGATAHNAAEAVKAEEDGADYLGVGAAFGSSTKADAKAIISLDE